MKHTHICVCLCPRLGSLLIVSAVPIMKEKTVKSEILIIWRECEGKGGVWEPRGGQAKGGPEWDGGRRGRDTRKKNQKTRERYLASHPQADEERMNGD